MSWLQQVDELLQEIGEGYEQYPLAEWERLREAGVSPEDAVEHVRQHWNATL